MAAVRLTMTWQDAQLRELTNNCYIDDSQVGASDVDLLAFLQDLQDMSQAKLLKATVERILDISGLTGSQPVSTGSFDSVGDKAILQWRKDAGSGVSSFSVPAPIDGIFQASGEYALADVDPTATEIVAMIATGETVPLLVTSEGTTVSFRKGWRSGQRHS